MFRRLMAGIAIVVVTAACAEAGPLQEPAATTPPSTAPSTTVEVVEAPSADGTVELIEVSYERQARPAPNLALLRLPSCTLINPSTYRMEIAALPAEGPTSGWIDLQLLPDDIGAAYAAIHVSVADFGTVALDITIRDQDPDLPHLIQRANSCEARATAEVVGYGEITMSAEPLSWDAEPGTLQALGLGVVLSDEEDPRLAWAEWRFAHGTTSFPEAVVVPPASGIAFRRVISEQEAGSPCAYLEAVSPGARFAHRQDCPTENQPPDDAESITAGIVSGVAWSDSSGRWWFDGFAGDHNVTMQADDRELLMALASAAEIIPSSDVLPIEPSPFWNESQDEAIAQTLAAQGFEELARIRHNGRIQVVAKGPLEAVGNTEPYSQIATYVLEQGGIYWIMGPHDSARWDQCLFVGPAPGGFPPRTLLVANDPAHGFEMRRDGGWVGVASLDGAAMVQFEDPTDRTDAEFRLVDRSGEPVDCPGVQPVSDGTTDTTSSTQPITDATVAPTTTTTP